MHGSGDRRRARVERGIYLQPNGNYTVCFMAAGKPRFRAVGADLHEARAARAWLIQCAKRGEVPVSPRLRFGMVASWWLERFAGQVEAGERRGRTLEKHRYHLERHLGPRLAHRRIASITVDDVAALLTDLVAGGCSARTAEGALASLHSIMRYALRHGWIVDDPVAKLEAGERPQRERRRQRVLGREEIRRLLSSCPSNGRPLVITALYTGMRISELLGLVWGDVDLDAGVIRVLAQLSRAHRGAPARRVAPKTRAALREIPLLPQLAHVLVEHRREHWPSCRDDWVFPSTAGTAFGHRNAQRRILRRAATQAGLEDGSWPPLRFHDLRHTFASHLIVDLGLDVAQVSRILGHASVTITLDVYTHLFDQVRHASEVRAKMAASAFGALIEPASEPTPCAPLLPLAASRTTAHAQLTARERATLRWAT
jgi:integrase